MTRLARLLAALFACAVLQPASFSVAQTASATDVSTVSTPELATPATTARDTSGIDYTEWERTASRAEEAIANGRASNRAMEQLRLELSGWREQFVAAQSRNKSRIATVREQIQALGEPPAEGVAEADPIAERRAELNGQLLNLTAPVVKAEEAFSRADGMIREIDSLIRARQADALLELGPSPLLPGNWVRGWSELNNSLRALYNEVRSDWENQLRRAEFYNNLPATLLLFGVGLVLILRGRRWTMALTNLLYRGSSRHSQRVLASVISLSQILLPYLGIVALVGAVQNTELLGLRSERLMSLVPQVGLLILVAAWLAGRVFPRQPEARPLLELPQGQRAGARLLVTGLAFVLAVNTLLLELARYDSYSPEGLAVLRFGPIVFAALLLFRLGRIMTAQLTTEDDGPQMRKTLMRQLGRFSMGVAVVAPVLAAIGYSEVAYFFTFPAILTLAILAVIAILQRFAGDLFVVSARGNEEAREGLIPVLVTFAIALAALPVLALVWGARVSDLTELWTRFIQGFDVGGTHISPSIFITFAAVFAIAYSATRLLQAAMRNSVLPKTKIDVGGQNAIVAGIGYVGVVLAAVLAITAAGIDLSSIAIVAGALSVGIGFGLQTIVSNFVSGIILLIERPVREGDWIEVGGVMGTVRDISVRSTRIETFDRTDVIVPNSDLISNQVTNWTKHNLSGRIILTVGVAYGSDTHKVEQILREVGEAHPLVIVNPPPLVVFQGFGADSLDFELRVILRDINFGLSARTAMNHEIARRFQEEGIEIPFAQRDIWLRNPEALASPPPKPAPKDTQPPQRGFDFDSGEAAEEDPTG